MRVLRNNPWKTCLSLLAVIYLFSYGIQILFPIQEKPHVNQKSLTIEVNSTEINHSYLEFGGEEKAGTIILFPDPFFDVTFLGPIAERLAEKSRVIIPVYPEKTAGGRNLNQSVDRLSGYAKALMDSLEIEGTHLVGHGFGNPVAVSILRDREDEFASYTMLSAIGVQELNYLGYHVLNSAVYSFIHAGSYTIYYGLPHAGWASQIGIDLQLARFLNRLDQRPQREILSNLSLPVLIVHGEDDLHVPVVNAQEHYRIIPQSEKQVFAGGHDQIEKKPEVYIEAIQSFLERVDLEDVLYSNEASEERVEAAKEDFDSSKRSTAEGWTLIIAIVLIALVSVVSEDLAAIGGGLVVASGGINFMHALIGSVAGILITDIIIYWLGRYVGSPVLKWVPFKWVVKERDVLWAEAMFESNGLKIIFISRFLPGTRFPTYFAAGIVKAKFSLFLFYFILAISIWAPLVIGVSVLLGTQMLVYLELYQEYAVYIIFGFIIAMFLLIKMFLPLTTRKGRKEVAVKLIRLKQKILRDN